MKENEVKKKSEKDLQRERERSFEMEFDGDDTAALYFNWIAANFGH